MGKAEFQAMVKFELLAKNLVAGVQKRGGYTCYVVIPRVLGSDEGMTLKEAIDQIGEFVGKLTGAGDNNPPFTSEQVENALRGIIKLENIKLILRQAYLFVKKANDDANKNENICEYAFNIAILNDSGGKPESDEASLFKLEEISIAVWSTDRQMILDSMDILDLSDIDKAIKHAAEIAEKDKDKKLIADKSQEQEDKEKVDNPTEDDKQENTEGKTN